MKISVGMDSFAKLRINDCYYVDKTEFIETFPFLLLTPLYNF